MTHARVLVPYLWSLPIVGASWYVGWSVHQHPPREEGWFFAAFFLALFIGYTITLVVCTSRAFTKHQLGHMVIFVVATFLGVLTSGMDYDIGISVLDYDIGISFLSLALAFWAFAITFVGALILLLIRFPFTRRKSPEAQG
jgi:hypothetical protein